MILKDTPQKLELSAPAIGGWLILVGIMFAIAIPGGVLHIIKIYHEIAAITSLEWFYHKIYELCSNALLLTLSIGAFVLFLRRSKKFPKFMLFLILTKWLFLAIKLPWLWTLPGRPSFEQIVRMRIGEVLLPALLAVYLLKSQRVRFTFIR